MEPNATNQNTTNQNIPQNTNPQPSTNQNTTPKEHHVVGPIVGSLIIVILLIVAALYIWTKRINTEVIPPAPESNEPVAEQSLSPEESQIINDTGLTDDLLNDLEDVNF